MFPATTSGSWWRKPEVVTLGISALAHDPAVAVVEDGKVLFAVEEERVTRKKNAWVFPTQALDLALKTCQMGKSDVSQIAFYWDDAGTLLPALWAEWPGLFSPHVRSARRMMHRLRAARSNSLLRQTIEKLWHPLPPPRMRFLEHHMTHATYAYRASGFDRALAVVVDGRGEFASLTVYRCEGNSIRRVHQVNMPASLGFVYAAVTQYLGFNPAADEYRVMGLAPYGKEDANLRAFFEQLLARKHSGFQVDLRFTQYQNSEALTESWLSPAVTRYLGPRRTPQEDLEQRHADIAYALQFRYEEVLLGLLADLARANPGQPLVLAGGCAMNSVCNGRIARERIFPDLYIPPAPGDQGAAVGAALSVYDYSESARHHEVNRRAQLGPRYTAGEITESVFESGVAFETPRDPCLEVASLLASGQVGAVFEGAMEFGPRALGNRSILADPRQNFMKDRVNSKVKLREPFRPFAAAILRERTREYTDHDFDSEYMNMVMPVLPRMRGVIPAVTHADGSCRFQTVCRSRNAFLWNLINSFAGMTGVPAVLNTSFNINGEPIVMTPRDAVRCFLGTDIDFLLLETLLLRKDRLTLGTGH